MPEAGLCRFQGPCRAKGRAGQARPLQRPAAGDCFQQRRGLSASAVLFAADRTGWAALAFREQGNRLIAIFAVTLAAVVHEEGDEIGERRPVGAVDDRLAISPPLHESGTLQFLEMEGDARRRRIIERAGDGTSGHAVSPRDDQHADYPQAVLVRERGEARERVVFVHIISTFHVLLKLLLIDGARAPQSRAIPETRNRSAAPGKSRLFVSQDFIASAKPL